MTKEDILHHFQDINFYYGDCMMYADLNGMLDELIAENKCFDGMTNGEVIQALFPQIELVEIYNGRHRFFLKGKESSAFDLKAEVKWLNAPYHKGR